MDKSKIAPIGPVQLPGTAPVGPVKLPSIKPGTLEGKAPPVQVRNLRPPVPFKPFDSAEVKAHPKLANPKGLEILNKTEQGLNAIGRSLREKGEILIEIEPVVPRSLAKDQIAKLKTAPASPGYKAKQFEVKNKVVKLLAEARENFKRQKQKAIDAKVQDKVDSITQPKTEYKEGGSYGGPIPSPVLAPLEKPVLAFSQPNPPGEIPMLGDPRYASLSVNTQLKKSISPLSVYFGVQGKIGVTILSQALDPGTFSIGFKAPLVGEKGIVGSAHVPYGPVPVPLNRADSGAGVEGEQGLSLTKEVRTTIMLGPVPVTFAAGAKGFVGVNYGMNAAAAGTVSSSTDAPALDATWYKEADQKAFDKSSYSIGLTAHVRLKAALTLYASAVAGGEVDLWLCTIGLQFGVATEINLFDGDMGYELAASVHKDPNGKAVGDLTLDGSYEIRDALHGELYFTATLDLCVKSVSYKYSIYSFDAGAQTGGPQYFTQEHLSDNLF